MTEPLRVLLIEDSEDDALLVERELRRGGWDLRMERVETVEATAAALARGGWDVVISDYALPALSAPEALRIVQRANADVPFIMVSGSVDEEMAVGALKAGAADFISKAKFARLVPAVRRELRETQVRRGRAAAEGEALAMRTLLAHAEQVAQMGSWEIDLSTRRVRMSSGLRPILGLDRLDAAASFETSDPLLDRVHPDDLARVSRALQRTREDLEPMAVEFRVVRPDGVVRFVHARAEIVRGPDGAAHRIVGTTQDVTERRLLEDHLRQAAKMEAVGRVAAGVAHDFNNMLGVVTSFAELVSQTLSADDPRRADMTEILAAVARAATLTRQLLAFGRQQELRPMDLDLNELVEGLQNMIRRAVGSSVTLALSLERPLGLVRADAGQIEQVILNLAVNARDAMPHGGTLTIATSNAPAARASAPPGATPRGPCVTLSITDTGTGMDAATRTHIFEPFFTTKAPGKGTGLGLASVHGIVQQSGGCVDVDSEVGRGTTFRISLPRLREGGS